MRIVFSGINKFFSLLLCLLLFLTICIGTKTVKKCLQYVALSQKTTAHVDSWHIEQKSASLFVIEALYHFSVDGRTFQGRTQFFSSFTKERLAREAIASLRTKPWTVFFSACHIEKNTLQRVFPFRDCLHVFLCIGACIFVLFLQMWRSTTYLPNAKYPEI